jgi:hypothetical protein
MEEAGAAPDGAGGFSAPEPCAKHPAAHHAIAPPSRTTRPAAVPQGMSLAARVFIRHSNRASLCGTYVLRLVTQKLIVHGVYSPPRRRSIVR